MIRHSVVVTHRQVCVFDPALDAPFNDWEDVHSRQGFTWRPYSVGFATILDGGDVELSVGVLDSYDESSVGSQRVVAVPFLVSEKGVVEFGGLFDSAQLTLAPGKYCLVFENSVVDEDRMSGALWFIPATSEVEPRIIRADAGLDVPATFCMEAQPAL